MTIAIVTTLAVLEGKDAAGRKENQRLKAALEHHGAQVRCIAWDGPEHEWHDVEAMVIRTTWNYHLHINAFRHFIDRRAAQGCHCFNAAELLCWNLDKHYLQDLTKAAVTVVPTQYLLHTESVADLALPAAWLQQPVVVKPTVSAGAHDTLRFDTGQQLLESSALLQLHRQHDLMIQPFQQGIAEGEISLITIGGELTHAVRKVPARGEFRVQGAYGGQVETHQPSEEEQRLASTIVNALPVIPAYARIDIVKGNDGHPLLMELELIEPQLFLELFPDSADKLARYVMTSLNP